MCWHDILVAIVMLNGLFEVIEITAPGISLITRHHSRPLPIAHGVGPTIGQQVDVYFL